MCGNEFIQWAANFDHIETTRINLNTLSRIFSIQTDFIQIIWYFRAGLHMLLSILVLRQDRFYLLTWLFMWFNLFPPATKMQQKTSVILKSPFASIFFKSCLLQMRQKTSIWGKGLRAKIRVTMFSKIRLLQMRQKASIWGKGLTSLSESVHDITNHFRKFWYFPH